MKTILIVEDDHSLGEMYIRLFHMNGYGVERAQNARDALDMLSTGNSLPAVILLDVHMPEMNGVEFLEKRKQNDILKSIPVVVITNSFYEEDEKKFLDLGASMFLIKIKNSNQDILEKIQTLI